MEKNQALVLTLMKLLLTVLPCRVEFLEDKHLKRPLESFSLTSLLFLSVWEFLEVLWPLLSKEVPSFLLKSQKLLPQLTITRQLLTFQFSKVNAQ
jgi:hypothetical protein